MAYSDSVEISNKGLRFVCVSGKNLVFAYEDGRKVCVELTSVKVAREYYNTNSFVSQNAEREAFFLDGVTSVSYIEPGE